MALGWRLAKAFLELCLKMTFLELWLRMEGKTRGDTELWCVLLVTVVSMQVVARMDGLHLIRQSRVMASDIANLVSKVRIVVHIRNSTWRY